MRKLTVDKKIAYTIAFALLAASTLFLFLPYNLVFWGSAALFIVAAVVSLTFIKKRSILSHNKRQILVIVAAVAGLFLVLYYLSGLHFGFGRLRSEYKLSIFYTYVIPIALIIIFSELARTVLVAQGSVVVSVATYFICILAELLIAGGVRGIASANAISDFLGMSLFPAITSNILFNYLAKRYGSLPNIAYRLILTLYYYIFNLIPNLPQILPAFLLLLLPIILCIFIDALFEKKVRRATVKKSKLRFVFPSILLVILTAFVMLVSCQFRFGIIVIATSSMETEIHVGDAVVFEDYEDYGKEAKINDVIVFSKDGKRRIVHRIVDINTIDGQKQYITKGDANEDNDAGFVTESQIVGVVHFKVLYIGYPSLWLREIFE